MGFIVWVFHRWQDKNLYCNKTFHVSNDVDTDAIEMRGDEVKHVS